MTDHEALIDEAEAKMLSAKTPADLRMWGGQFLLAVMNRNAERTPEQVELLEKERGLR